ncbi:Hydroxysteroid dehydrogenase-like protein 2 [Lepeophtheirus salmonis]|uniref:Hydroxysteroid dehydrogenase-like protein 2 n=2 Tax=Lepeophtheirus salmonis TaxID=72036 RepID=A0A7R8D4P5_LEPSM|nr:Hydroxysteroid dehydrogenase-like protein 2 [Lepeophtheirus salmonis]CAF3027595.1 Hydroxysteroid dehydrogenase-like protein 2 [Lepeophtheirus salmonis]
MLNTGKLAGKTIYITGASRGIGKAIALKAAKDGARIVVAAKTSEPHPKLPGTIYTAAEEIEKAGGKALPCVVDVRSEESVQQSVELAVRTFGGIDILINNASAISLTGTQQTSMKKYDLMNSVNARGTYLVSKCCLPYLIDSKNNPHILNISPPMSMNPVWFKNHVAYTMAKYGMSMCVLGMAEEFRSKRIGVNALWPQTAIMTAAMEMLGGKDIGSQCRKPDIMADAAYVILNRIAREYTGHFAIDEDILREEGVKDFDGYAVAPGNELMLDFFLDGDVKKENASSDKSERDGIDSIMTKIGQKINPDLVGKTKSVFAFQVSGKEYFIDLKNGAGSCGKGSPSSSPDATFILEENDFQSMFEGKLKPQSAFLSGKLKLEGDLAKAMTFEKLMKNMRQYHTRAGSTYVPRRNYSEMSTDVPTYTNIPQVFDRIKEVANSETIQKVNAVYVFDVEGEGKYFVDLKKENGLIGKSNINEDPDVTISINQENFLKLFNRELKPATAFMTGKLKLSGDLSKAMALEAVMKASRAEFHTSAYMRGPVFSSVPEIFERIGKIASAEVVAKVKATYCFNVEDEGKYYIDFKSGDGQVGTGDPPSGKPDVTIKMKSSNLLKLFNRELSLLPPS